MKKLKNEFPRISKIGDLYKIKESYHMEMARIPYEEKIKMLVEIQKIVRSIKGDDYIVWDIEV
jgi:hypothetical protein